MEEIQIFCPHCGDVIPIGLGWTFSGELVEDCPSCGRSVRLSVWRDEWGDPQVSVESGTTGPKGVGRGFS